MADSDLNSDRINRITKYLPKLTKAQLQQIDTIVQQYLVKHIYNLNPKSDLINDKILEDIGNKLKEHAASSKDSFSKDKFEYMMEAVFNRHGIPAKLADKGNPGHDITINKERISLKTQANKDIKTNLLWISKFRELGKGEWSDKEENLYALKDQFLDHMKSYDRIFSLRTLKKVPPDDLWHYELVEIPKSLLLEAENGEFEMKHDSNQVPKPGYCRVYDGDGVFRRLKYELYFDGGTERKLQIKNLDKTYCIVHAEWIFYPPPV